MLHRIPMKSRALAALVAAAFGIAGLAWAAPADDLREGQKLYSQGKAQAALDRADAVLRLQPKDPQARFLKGLALTELKRTQEAIQVFTGLTEDFPELPEPYNNLAVLYASQGNYDKAKSALELAIHTHPSYATAHENLGDVYAQLASRAYDRALQLDKGNTTAQSKLAMVKELFSSKAGAPQASAPARSEPAKVETRPEPAKVEPAKVEPPGPAVVAKADPPRPAPAKADPAKVEPAKVEPVKPTASAKAEAPKAAEAAKAPPKAEAPKPAAAPASDEDKARVTAAIEAWAAAWSRKDVKAYLEAYSPDFDPPGRMSRAAWEKQRHERIERPKTIEVGVKVKSIEVKGDQATAVIDQSYRSDTLKSDNVKTLRMRRAGERWLITEERIGG